MEATVPVLTSSPLWTIPSVEIASDSTGAVSPSTLNANGTFVCLLVELIGTMRTFVEDSSLRESLVFGLVERASPLNAPTVKATAYKILKDIANSESVSVGNLVRMYFDSTMASVRSQVRSLASRGNSVDIESWLVCSAMLRFTVATLLGEKHADLDSLPVKVPTEVTSSDPMHSTIVTELATAITVMFDKWFIPDQLLTTCATELLGLYRVSTQFLALSVGISLSGLEERTHNPSDKVWLKLIDPFRREVSDGKSGIDFFKAKVEAENAARQTQKAKIEISSTDLNFLDMVADRCGYFLSITNLRVQRESCVVKGAVFQVLGELGASLKVCQVRVPVWTDI